tara:strand:+ start:65 stop:478 length:414 start_codon:yes stop_codon:yes gene_type:complete
MKITLVKQLNGQFKLAYDSDFEQAKKIKVGEFYEFSYSKPRNYMFHKKFFALVELVYQNQEAYSNKDDLRKDLTIDAGFYRVTTNLQGNEVKKAQSISFAQMDEIEFNEFYNRFIDAVVRWLKIDKQDLIDNITQYF